MATHPKTAIVTLDDFLAAQDAMEERSEFVDGQVVALGAASFAHNLIVGNLFGTLFSALRGSSCRVVSQGMLVKPVRSENAFLPDLAVFCGAAELEARSPELLANPVLIIEVLSPGTADYDRGTKWEQYRRIPTLRDYLLVSQDRARVEWYARHGDGFWLFSETEGPGGEVRLEGLDATLRLADIYDGVLAAEPDGGAGADESER